MGIRVPSIIFLLIFSVGVMGQINRSAHYNDYIKYKNLKNEGHLEKSASDDIIPLDKSVKKNLTKSVFGFYPDWEYLKKSHNNFNYDLLTHIAAFDFTVNTKGQIKDPADWPWTDVINKAHENGVKMIMVVVNFNADSIHTLLTNSFSRWAFMVGVKNKIEEYKLDGVNIDFEGLKSSDRGSVINDFMKELTETVHALDPDFEVSFDAPAVNWGGWDFNGLAASCDYLFVMGYDFYGKWSDYAGPSAPLFSNSPYNVNNTIRNEYATLSTFYPEKLILGVPYYGPHWITETENEGSKVALNNDGVKRFLKSEFYYNAQNMADNKNLNWSNTFSNSWFSYTEGSDIHQVWYDNDSSLSLKYDLAITKKLKGIGMWALGYDGARPELWNLIQEKFSIPVSVEDNNTIVDRFSLGQNYPNPFNPTTSIKYTIPKISGNFHNVTLKVYDVLGRSIAVLVNEPKAPGSYEVTFNASAIPSGTYFYRLQFGDYSETKKLMLLK